MADPPPYRDASSDTDVGPDRDSQPGTPRWVKVFGIITLIVVLLFVILMFTRGPGGRHGPARHMRSDDPAGQIPRYSVTEGHTPAESGHR